METVNDLVCVFPMCFHVKNLEKAEEARCELTNTKFVVMPKMIHYRFNQNQMCRVNKVVGVGRGNALCKQHKLTLKRT